MTHWRTFLDSDVIRYADIMDHGDITFTIKSVKGGTVAGKNKRAMIEFEGRKKPLAAGSAICKTVAQLYGNDTRQWVGKSITIYADHNVMFGGEKVGGIRVRPVIPAAPQPEKAASNG